MPPTGTAGILSTCALLLLGWMAGLSARGQEITDWKAKNRGHIFPSLIIARASSEMELSRTEGVGYDQVADLTGAPLEVGVEGAGNAAFLYFLVHFEREFERPVKLTFEIVCPKFMEPARLTQKLAGGARWIFAPFIAWKFDALYAVTEPEPTTVTYRILGESGEELGRRSVNMLVHSINECVLEYMPYERLDTDDGRGYFITSPYHLAAYVNENHPLIDRILKSALDRKLVPRLLGPQVRDESEARRELEAIWQALQALGLRYSSVARVATQLEFFRTQNVRFLDEVMTSTQLNCVDGSVLLASTFVHLGLDAELILFPNHCLVQVQHPVLGEVFLETTLLGSEASVWEARQAGTERFDKVKSRFEKDDYGRPKIEGYHRVNLREVRKGQIQPLRSRRATATREQ